MKLNLKGRKFNKWSTPKEQANNRRICIIAD